MRLIIQEDAQEKILEIYNYIAYDSIKYANETFNNIYLRINNLRYFPYIGRYVPELRNKKYRELVYKSYRIIYKVSEDTDEIQLITVIHSKRNF